MWISTVFFFILSSSSSLYNNFQERTIYNSLKYNLILHKMKQDFSYEKSSEPESNNFLNDKKLITFSPGGYRGFYMFGIGKYIKKKYNLSNYVFSGASAGAWVSLLMCFKGSLDNIETDIMNPPTNPRYMLSMEKQIKYKILSKYQEEDFDLRRLFIGVTTLSSCKPHVTVYSNFQNLEDALDCCIASSHIPFVTGGMNNIYRNSYTFDGGFSKYPFLNKINSTLDVTPYFWDDVNKINSTKSYMNMFSPGKYSFSEIMNNGYNDSFLNKNYLDNIFL